MKRVTRNIDPARVRDLLERTPRACLCFACNHGPQAQPVRLVWQDGPYLGEIPLSADHTPHRNHPLVMPRDICCAAWSETRNKALKDKPGKMLVRQCTMRWRERSSKRTGQIRRRVVS